MPGVLCSSPTSSSGDSVLGEAYGICEACEQADATMSCFQCGLGAFCEPECVVRHQDDGEHICPQERLTAVLPSTDELLDSIALGVFRMGRQALSDYRFDKCADDHEMAHLLTVYATLLNDLNVNKFQLHEWMRAKEIHKNAVRMFNRDVASVVPIAFLWLLTHTSVFDGEDVTDTLDIDAFEEIKREPDESDESE